MEELVVDNFAGGGGASVGIEQAIGRPVDLAINHDAEAIAMHKANHPATRHLCESLLDVDPVQATAGRPVGLAWFSPDCSFFSKAAGKRPIREHGKKSRALAWVVIRWMSLVRPRVVILENVEEFADWGPVLRNGKPCPRRRGQTFGQWIGHMQALGYAVEWQELRACDYGAPTIRKRLFVIARRDGLPICWPEPSHGPGRRPYRTAAEIIDWSRACPSIFERRKPLATATLRRIARGVVRYVIEAAEPFLIPVTHGGDARVFPLDEPLRTITCAPRGEFALIAPYLVPRYGEAPGQEPRVRPVTEPTPTIVPSGNGGRLVAAVLTRNNPGNPPRDPRDPLGTVTTSHNRHAIVAAFLAQHNGGAVGRPATAPIATLTSRGTQVQAVTSHLVKLRGTCADGQPVTEPVPTLTAGGQHVGEVRAFLLKYYGTAIGQGATEPLHSATARARFGLVMVAGEPWQIVDIGMRMLTPRELFRAQGLPDSYVLTPLVPRTRWKPAGTLGDDPTAAGTRMVPLTATAQIRMCGNSVPPAFAEALVASNYSAGQVRGREGMA
jgi:DNA (cytosine-5)-methyltransferase 1